MHVIAYCCFDYDEGTTHVLHFHLISCLVQTWSNPLRYDYLNDPWRPSIYPMPSTVILGPKSFNKFIHCTFLLFYDIFVAMLFICQKSMSREDTHTKSWSRLPPPNAWCVSLSVMSTFVQITLPFLMFEVGWG